MWEDMRLWNSTSEKICKAMFFFKHPEFSIFWKGGFNARCALRKHLDWRRIIQMGAIPSLILLCLSDSPGLLTGWPPSCRRVTRTCWKSTKVPWSNLLENAINMWVICHHPYLAGWQLLLSLSQLGSLVHWPGSRPLQVLLFCINRPVSCSWKDVARFLMSWSEDCLMRFVPYALLVSRSTLEDIQRLQHNLPSW